MEAKKLDQAFTEAALKARDADPATFLTALDAAVQAAALHPGARVLAALLNSPPLSSEAERTLQDLVDLCRAKSVRVVVLDIGESGPNDPKSALRALATDTGGMWLRQGKALEQSVLTASVGAEAPEERAVVAAPAPVESAGAGMKFEIPIHTRFIRTSMTGTIAVGSIGHVDANSSGETQMSQIESGFNSTESFGPMRGIILVESPLSALKFDVDDNAGTYLARARILSTVRNSKGVAVWSGKKEVTVTGPIRKLSIRRQGSLLFLRGLTLPGGSGYMLEAKVEDLLAGSNGTIRTPLRTGRGAPGLMASDALLVRPFSGSADKFEADQVLSYEGEALSPMLNPVFHADEPVNLQLYLILYPDINGAPPALSLELLRDGKVVTRAPMQFKTQLRNLALEGKFGSMSGKGSSMYGGRAKEFPYLADIKGAKLSPGDYEAVISIGQGRNVITRNVPFRVVGDKPAAVKIARGPGFAGQPAADSDDVELPEIEPVTVDSGGFAMPAGEQKRLWDEAGKNALAYSSHLPNFRCLQETHRFTAPAKTPDQLKEADSFKDELTYEGGKESYRTIEIDGVKTDTTRGGLKGVHSRGEFGSMLLGLFDPDIAAQYKWAGRSMAMGVLCQVFDVEVARAKSNFTLSHNGRREPIGYAGRIFIDEETGLVRRLTIQGVGLAKDFGLQSPAFSLEYSLVRIGSEDYLLPLRSVLQLRQLKKFVRNETVFRGYRRFDASSEIKFENK